MLLKHLGVLLKQLWFFAAAKVPFPLPLQVATLQPRENPSIPQLASKKFVLGEPVISQRSYRSGSQEISSKRSSMALIFPGKNLKTCFWPSF